MLSEHQGAFNPPTRKLLSARRVQQLLVIQRPLRGEPRGPGWVGDRGRRESSTTGHHYHIIASQYGAHLAAALLCLSLGCPPEQHNYYFLALQQNYVASGDMYASRLGF